MQRFFAALPLTGFFGALLIAALAGGAPIHARQLPAANKTVWDGAYTEDQAKRGEAVYASECRSCHGADLMGQQSRLIGDRFMRDWREDNLASLFNRIKAGMPFNAPASLRDEEYFDVTAYVLQQNAFPPGNEELNGDSASKILLVGKEGPQAVPDFAMVQLVGCLTQDSTGSWILTNAAEPRRTRTPDVTADELKAASDDRLGTGTFKLLEAAAYHPEGHRGHKISLKGLLIRKPDNRINVTGLDTIASSCTP